MDWYKIVFVDDVFSLIVLLHILGVASPQGRMTFHFLEDVSVTGFLLCPTWLYDTDKNANTQTYSTHSMMHWGKFMESLEEL